MAASGTRVVYSVHQRPLSCTECQAATAPKTQKSTQKTPIEQVPGQGVAGNGGRCRSEQSERSPGQRQGAAAEELQTSQKSSLLAALLRICCRRSGALRTKKEADLLVDLFGDACRIQTYDLLIRSQMLYSAELRRQSHTGEPVLYYYSTSFIRPRLASLMRAFLPARARM